MNKETIKSNIAMSNDAIKLIESYLDKDDIVYEYGKQDVESTYQLAVAQLSKLKMGWGDLYV